MQVDYISAIGPEDVGKPRSVVPVESEITGSEVVLSVSLVSARNCDRKPHAQQACTDQLPAVFSVEKCVSTKVAVLKINGRPTHFST